MWMMVLEALVDINLVLLNLDANSADLSLERTLCLHNMGKSSIIRWRRWSNLKEGGSSMLINLYRRRLRCFTLTFKPKLSIRIHESLTPKRILNTHHGLSLSNVRHRMETDLCD